MLLRGKVVAYVPQDPPAAINPSLRFWRQIAEIVQVHEPAAPTTGISRHITKVMHNVGLPTDDTFLSRYPHQLSGGQLQCIGIAMAVILKPRNFRCWMNRPPVLKSQYKI